MGRLVMLVFISLHSLRLTARVVQARYGSATPVIDFSADCTLMPLRQQQQHRGSWRNGRVQFAAIIRRAVVTSNWITRSAHSDINVDHAGDHMGRMSVAWNTDWIWMNGTTRTTPMLFGTMRLRLKVWRKIRHFPLPLPSQPLLQHQKLRRTKLARPIPRTRQTQSTRTQHRIPKVPMISWLDISHLRRSLPPHMQSLRTNRHAMLVQLMLQRRL